MTVLIIYKVLFLGFVILYSTFCPQFFNTSNYLANFHWPQASVPQVNLEMHLSTWDAQHYLYLSQFGYKPNTQSCAFLPLWPFTIYLFSKIFLNPFVASLIVSNTLSLVAGVMYFKFIKRLYGLITAQWSLIFLFSFPGALFFQFPYSESLFFLLTVLFFVGLLEKKPALLALSGLFLPFTRMVGVLLILPALYNSLVVERDCKIAIASTLSICFGFALLLFVMMLSTGDCFANFHAQERFVSQGSISRLLSPLSFLTAFLSVTGMHNQTHSLIDRVLFCVYLSALYPIWKLNKTFFVYSILLGFLPVVGNHFMSSTRYLTAVFPMFICAAQYFSDDKRRLFAYLLVMLGLAVQCFLTLWHVDNCWAG